MKQSGRFDFSFPKKEKLTGKKEIEGLFKNGSSFYVHPLILKFEKSDGAAYHKVLITVSKKNFKRAVDRNLLKRRIREAYRLNKHLITETNVFYHLGFVYVGKSLLPYHEIEEKLKFLLQRLQSQIVDSGNTSQINEK